LALFTRLYKMHSQQNINYSKMLVNFEHITWYHTLESSFYSLVCKSQITRIVLLFITEKMASAMFW